MEAAAKLIAAIASLIGAVAWPSAILAVVYLFKREIKTAVERVPAFIDRMRKMKIAGIEAELDKVADASVDLKSGDVTAAQVRAAAWIAVEADRYEGDLLAQLDRLCLEYDGIRRSMNSGRSRTQAMTRVIVKMRALAPSLGGYVTTFKVSGSAGSRLAAIAMMQMNPDAADIQWLGERFSLEQPFIFYHAALALQNLATDGLSNVKRVEIISVAQRGLRVVKSFKGNPDQSTIEVLEHIIQPLEIN